MGHPSHSSPQGGTWYSRNKGLTPLIIVGLFIAPFVVGLMVLFDSTSGGGSPGAVSAADGSGSEGEGVVDSDNSSDDSSDSSDDAAEAENEASESGSVRDGKFEFTVTGMETATELGEAPFAEEAQGKFLLISISVANVGDEPRMLTASSQKLYDADGREFKAESSMAALGLDDYKTFLENINPGNGVDGILVFDIPEDAIPDKLELHDSMFSGGASISLH